MNIKLVAITLIALLSIRKCKAKNILCLMGIGTESTDKWNKVLLKDLANKGHDLTIISTSAPWNLENENENEDEWPNTEFIHLEKTEKFIQQRFQYLSNPELLMNGIWKYIIHWYDRQLATCQGNLESIAFSEVLNLAEKETFKYDLILVDVTYGWTCLFQLIHMWNDVPIIGITGDNLNVDILNREGMLMKPSWDPYMLSDLPADMNYWQRLKNTALYVFDYCYREWLVKPVIQGILSKNMPPKNIDTPSSVNDLMPRLKVILANYHSSLHSMQTLPVNVIPVPGLHIQEKVKNPLEKDYFNFMKNIKLQVILIDMDIARLGLYTTDKVVDIIQSLPSYGFIWLNGDKDYTAKNKPGNLLLTVKESSAKLWQHPKVQCSVITGDLLKIQESIFYGIPFISIATRPEEKYLNQRATEGNFGIAMDLLNFTTENFEENLKKCLLDKSLHQNIQSIQYSLKNLINSPLKTANWWVDHIANTTHTTKDLYSSKSKPSLGYFTENSLDVIVLIQIFIIMGIINTIVIVRQIVQGFKKVAKSKKVTKTKLESSEKKIKKMKTKIV